MRDLVKTVTGSNCGERLKIISIDEAKEMLSEYADRQDKRAFIVYTCLLIEEGLAQIDRYHEPLDNELFPEISPESVQQTVERLPIKNPD
ncbi:hypothetical protein EV175_006800 [Coemansia sp. RSA 1933]|nr:hypothetical protein EV175_006800 [Coemansia sp. RSA 1933]